MKRHVKLFMAFIFLWNVGLGNCDAGTYTSKENPQHSVEYEETFRITIEQCKNYSRQNHPGVAVRCWSSIFPHFYLDGEIVDDRMDEIATQTQIANDVFLFIFVIPLIGLLLCLIFYLYMLPTFIAYKRGHPQRVFIMLLNLFFGNTLVGWVAALIWAHTDNTKHRREQANNS